MRRSAFAIHFRGRSMEAVRLARQLPSAKAPAGSFKSSLLSVCESAQRVLTKAYGRLANRETGEKLLSAHLSRVLNTFEANIRSQDPFDTLQNLKTAVTYF